MEDPWQEGKSSQQCNDYMLTHQVASDVVFHVQHPDHDNEDVSAHKYILISRSPVFYAMLCGKMSTNIIEIVDIEPKVFKMMLRYLYTDEIELNLECIFSVIYAAKKYMIPNLVLLCSKRIMEEVSSDNVCDILNRSLQFDEIRHVPMRYIEENTTDVACNEGFLDLTRDALSLLTKDDKLSISEIDLINAVVHWSEAECKRQDLPTTVENKRAVLGDVISELRFHKLPPELLADFARETCLLSDNQIGRVFLNMYPSKPKQPLPDDGPSPAKREPPLSHESSSKDTGSSSLSKPDVKGVRTGRPLSWMKLTKDEVQCETAITDTFFVRIQCDKNILIYGLQLGIGFYPPNVKCNKLSLSILNKNGETLIHETHTSLHSSRTRKTWTVNFATPVRVGVGKFTIKIIYKKENASNSSNDKFVFGSDMAYGFSFQSDQMVADQKVTCQKRKYIMFAMEKKKRFRSVTFQCNQITSVLKAIRFRSVESNWNPRVDSDSDSTEG